MKEFLGGKVQLYGGDSREVLKTLADASVDSVVCDPPYGLEFMGKEWDRLTYSGGNPSMKSGERAIKNRGGGDWQPGSTYGGRQKNHRCRRCGKLSRGNGSCKCPSHDWSYRHDESGFQMQAWHMEWAVEAFRVLKPGGHLVAFSGTRTYHRLAVAIEDAGFEIRDQLAWVYGSGFPKSLDVSKAIDKAAGAEREVIGQKRNLKGDSGEQQYAAFGVFQQSKFSDITAPATDAARQWAGWGTALKPSWEPIVLARKPLIGTVAANVLAHGTGAINVDGCRIEGGEIASAGGTRRSGGIMGKSEPLGGWEPTHSGRWPANLIHDGSKEVVEMFPESDGNCNKQLLSRDGKTTDVYGSYSERSTGGLGRGDSGSAARFFYTAKVDATTYNLENGQGRSCVDTGSAVRFYYTAKASADDRLGSKHPTVKPLDLMQWLVRLVTPKGGTVLDPFSGTGTTGEAAWREGMRAILIEREEEYQQDIARRMELAEKPTKRAAVAKTKNKLEQAHEMPLFASLGAAE